MNNWIKKQEGSALIYALILIVVLSILGVSLLSVGLFETKVSVSEKKHVEAYLLAKSGALATAAFLVLPTNDDDLKKVIDAGESSQTELESGSGNYFTVNVTDISIPNELQKLKIVSTGVVLSQGGIVSEQESVILKKNTLYTKAIFAMGDIVNDNNSFIDGEVETRGTITLNDSSHITGYPGIENSTNSYPDPVMPNTVAFETAFGSEYPSQTFPPDLHMPDAPPDKLKVSNDLTIRDNIDYTAPDVGYGDFKYDSMSIKSSTTLTFDISSDMRIFVEDFYANNAIINVKSSTGTQGKLYMYVENSFDFRGDIISLPETFYLIVNNGASVHMQTGNEIFNGYIYGPGADVNYKSGTFSGAIICDDFTIEAGGKVFYDDSGISNLGPENIGLSSFGYSIGLWGK